MGLNDFVKDLRLLGLMEIIPVNIWETQTLIGPGLVCVCVSFVCISFVSVTKCWEMGYSLICGCQCVCFKFQRSPLCWWWATRAKIQLQSVTKTSQALTLSRECFNAAYCGIGVVPKRIITYFYFCISSFLRRNNWMNRPKLATTNQPWSFL